VRGAARKGGPYPYRDTFFRFLSEDVRGRILQQTLVNPIRHGARAELPRMDSEPRLLFE
jgi:hypothetical protein